MYVQRPILAVVVLSLLAGSSSVASAQAGGPNMHGMHAPDIVIPAGARYTKADVEFMQGMIAHHAQAIVMARFAESNNPSPQVLKLSRKIDQSQVPEIQIMQEWLRQYKQFAPDTSSWRHMSMTGMLTTEQLKELEVAKGVDFDRAFLKYMIMHHDGALKMVDDRFESPMAGQEVDVSVFANEVATSQTGEIGIMRRLLSQLPSP